MFHGPVDQALPFFQSHLGFECPVRKDAASFLQEVTTPKGEQTCYMHVPLAKGMASCITISLMQLQLQLLMYVFVGQLTYATAELRKRKGLAPLHQPDGDQFAAAAEFQVQPYLSTFEAMGCSMDHRSDASLYLLAAKMGLALPEQGATDLLVPVDEIALAFWEETEWGQVMREQLDDKPFAK